MKRKKFILKKTHFLSKYQLFVKNSFYMIIKTGYYLMWTKDLVQYSIFFKFEDDIVFEISIMKKTLILTMRTVYLSTKILILIPKKYWNRTFKYCKNVLSYDEIVESIGF